MLLAPLSRLTDAVLGLRGWRRALVMVLAGLCSVLALPPFHAWPVLLVTLPLLFLAVEGARGRGAAFMVGWFWGIGFWAAGLYWIGHAFLVHSDRHAWMIPIALPLLGIGMGLFCALTALLTKLASGPSRLTNLLGFALAWGFIEWVRNWVFTGFPWNPIATIWASGHVMLQFASVVGVFGLGILTVLALALPMVALPLEVSQRLKGLAASIAILAGLFLFGTLRLPDGPAPVFENVPLLVVQPNIPQKEKWQRTLRLRNVQTQLDVSASGIHLGEDVPRLVIWPETAVPYALSGDEGLFTTLGSILPEDSYLLTGAPRRTPDGQFPFEIWNSLFVIERDGSVAATFDKAHLVPFGEYVPLKSVLPLQKITEGRTDFSFGDGLRTLELPGVPAFSPLICYEVIFSGKVMDRSQRPAWLLNLTNDGWYGKSAGPYQHLAASRMRAIEEGLPLVRAANTGISLVTDPYGRIIASVDLLKQGVIQTKLPEPIDATIFFYLSANNIISGSIFVLIFLLIFRARQARLTTKR